MSHLQRRYTDYFYVQRGKGEKARLQKVQYMKRADFIKANPGVPLPGEDGVFPCQHEERGFVSKKGKKRNHTHRAWKRRNKGRIKARNAR